MSALLSQEPFVAHSYQELVESGAFDPPLPEAFYTDLLKQYELIDDVEVTSITYKSEGFVITGLVAVPKIVKPGRHPVLIYNRGGYKEYGKLTLYSVMRSMVPFAREGYLVFASNYRGSAGGGGVDDFGGADVADVLNLLNIAKSRPGYDGKNAFMVGHSRGGMMTYGAIKRGARINAAVSIAGIADVRPDGDKNQFKTLLARPDAERAIVERSAVLWPEMLTVPLLLLHGDNDTVLPHWHSEALAAQLKARGQPHELEIYPGGNHALVRHWDLVTARITHWLKAHRR